jgi:hypothetical protein
MKDPDSRLRTMPHAITESPISHTFVCRPGDVRPSAAAECTPCAYGMIANEDTNACERCELNQVASDDRSKCICAEGHYDASLVRPACHKDVYADIQKTTPAFKCQPCAGMECIDDCRGDWLNVSSGWSPLPSNTIDIDIFACEFEEACLGGSVALTTYTSLLANITDTHSCLSGHAEPLCASCTPGYSLKSDGACETCGGDDATSTQYFVVGVIFIDLKRLYL